MVDLFESNDWANICHSIAVTNGFWDTPPDDLQAFTFRQLCHALSEFSEFDIATGDEKQEEMADIAIVLLDLLGAHGISFTNESIEPDYDAYDIPFLLGRIANEYRKYNTLCIDYIKQVLGSLEYELSIYFDTTLLAEIEKKCRKNINRPRKHGLFEYKE